jgi:hypothetical protein
VELGSYKLLLILPVMVFIAALEALYLGFVREKTYAWRESLASAAVAVGHHLAGAVTAGAMFGALTWLWQYRLFTISLTNGWSLFFLFLSVEFFYYWFHRLSHESRWFWLRMLFIIHRSILICLQPIVSAGRVRSVARHSFLHRSYFWVSNPRRFWVR